MLTYHDDCRSLEQSCLRKNSFQIGCLITLFVAFVSGINLETLDAASHDQAKAALEMGMSYYNSKQYDHAISEFKSFLTKHSNHTEKNKANYFLAESFIQTQKPDEAFIYFDAILGNQLSAMKVVPEERFFDDEYYIAQVQPKMVSVKKEPFAREALFRVGEMEYHFNRFDTARRFLFSFIIEFSEDPFNAWALPYLGDIAKQNYATAIARGSHHVARVYAQEAEFYFKQSVVKFEKGKYYKESYFGLAWAEARLGKYDQAAPKFKQLAFDPEGTLAENAFYEWAQMLYDQGNYESANNTLATFERNFPQSELYNDSLRLQAKSLLGLEKYQEALTFIEKLNQRKAIVVEDYLLQIRCLYGIGNRQQASERLKELDQSQYANAVKDQIRAMQAYEAASDRDWNKAISILENLLRIKYDQTRREMTFGYFDEPETRRHRGGGAGRSGGYVGTQSITSNSHTISQGKLSEEAFLKACAGLCIAYAASGDTAKSNAAFSAMSTMRVEDDQRHTQIIEATMKYLAQIGKGSGGSIGSGAGSGSGGIGSGAIPIPINPGREDGFDFGSIVNIDGNDLQPAGGNYQPPGRGGGGPRRDRPGQNRPDNQDSDSIGGTDPNARYGSSTPSYDPPSTQNNNPMQTSADLNRALQNCESLVRNKKWEDADKKLLAIMSNPIVTPQTGAKAALLRCDMMQQLGNFEEANVMCETIITDYPNTIQCGDALWILGDYYEKSGDLDKSLKYFTDLADEYPTHKQAAGAVFHLAWDEMENGNPRTAKRYFRRIYTDYPRSLYWSHGTWGLAYMSYEDKKYDDAKKLIQEVLDHPPDETILDRVLYLKGKLAEIDGDWEIAETAYRTLVEYCPDSPLRHSASVQAAAASRAKRNGK